MPEIAKRSPYVMGCAYGEISIIELLPYRPTMIPLG